jgi:hypothetical protein
MKSLSAKLGVILVVLIIFGYAEAWGANWKLLHLDDEMIKYYDAEGITRPSKNIVRVWVRFEYKDKGVNDMVQKFGKDYENLKYEIGLEEVDCVDTHGQARGTCLKYKLCLTPYGRVPIHPRPRPWNSALRVIR